MSWNMADSHPVDLPEGISSQDDVVIALMGPTGAGKSTFIKTITGREDIQIGHDLTSETVECKAYQFEHAGTKFALVDTPGFNDTYLDDAAILAQLAAFMEASYRAKARLNAIIYLHPIVNDRLEGSALDNLSMFRRLCGRDCYPNIILATTFWSVVDLWKGAQRERELKETEEFWGGMISRGSRMIRLPDARAQCIELLVQLSGNKKMVLQIQDELVTKGLSIADTEAAKGSKASQALEALQREALQRFAAIADEHKRRIQAQQQKYEEEYERMKLEQQRVWDEQLRKQREEIEQLKKQHEERADAQRRDVLRQQAEMEQKANEESERLRLELQRLELEAAATETERKKIENAEGHRQSQAAINQRSRGQWDLVALAKQAGRIKISTSEEWYRKVGLSRTCDACHHSTGAGLSYRCADCDDWDVCETCFEEGRRCLNIEHTTWFRRSLVGTVAGKCRRAKKPTRERYRFPCDRCSKFIDGVFVHCCKCNSDNYDICLQCLITGKTCLDGGHELQFMFS